MFDLASYQERRQEMASYGDPAGLESFILHELQLIDTPYSMGTSCPCSKTQEQVDAEGVDWINDRLTAQVHVRTDLAGFYREQGQWDKCFKVFDDLYANLDEADMLETPLHGRILLNEACLRMETNDLDAAFRTAKKAADLFEADGNIAPGILVSVYQLLSAIYRRRGDNENADLAYSKALAADKLRNG